MRKAIVLAAGVGSRLRPLTNYVPKCCVEVGGRTLLARLLDQLLEHSPGIRVYVAAGYKAEKVFEQVQKFGRSVEVVENVAFATTNNMESCRLVLSRMETNTDVAIVNGDCIYSDSIVSAMTSAVGDWIGVDSGHWSEESMKVRVEGERIRDISKTIPSQPGCFSSIDFYNFSAESSARLLAVMESFHARGDVEQWTEVAIRELVASAPALVRPLDISGEPWVEIDDLNDLDRANALWGERV
jgi:L-glutamine-phosphate cytidylyltransferase